MKKIFRWIGLLLIISTLSGCFYWIRVYQTYSQMDEFDENFSITADDVFNLNFKEPKLYSYDFISLLKVQPTTKSGTELERQWRYLFKKIDKDNKVITPEISFYFNLSFNLKDQMKQWTLSSLFLHISPAEFLEVSIRSIAGAEINKTTRQLKANTDSFEKILTDLPQKKQILSQLGEPIEIKDKEENEVYLYHFLLQTDEIEDGYEDRALNKVELTFDKKTDELIKMTGHFVGLKISIKYRNYLVKKKDPLTLVLDKKSQITNR